MSLLTELLQVVVPVFLIIAAGYGVLKARLLADNMVDALVAFQIRAAVPCLCSWPCTTRI